MQTNTKHNRLIEEESPYLRQHAENPVDWYPWGEEAFKKADREDKPVFLSIGYSTCHWCHVMAEESFEDEKVADLLNENFVSIKVDREERPDIDSIYMQACQLMNGHGGWPLSIFMTPDKKPFYAATYIPKEGRGRRTGMMELLPAISRLWREDRERLLASAEKITEAVRGNGNRGPGGKQELDEKIFSRACSRLEAEYDEENGGFGSSPKFPMNHRLLFLCDFSREEGKNLGEDDSTVEATGEKCERYRAMTEKTLQSMRCGGIYDQLGFGFHRYSTDEKWKVPHFEKMLYDQALLVKAYLAGYQISGREVYAETVKEIIEYVSRDM
ncbi:MAG: thioredoxin domain-containing protein, partial [Halanaerobiales bacterium]